MEAGYGREQAAQEKVLKGRNSYKPEGSKSREKMLIGGNNPKQWEWGVFLKKWVIIHGI